VAIALAPSTVNRQLGTVAEVGVVAVEPGERATGADAVSKRSTTLPVMVMSVLFMPISLGGRLAAGLPIKIATILQAAPGMVVNCPQPEELAMTAQIDVPTDVERGTVATDVAAAFHAAQAPASATELAQRTGYDAEGTFLLVEPMAGEHLEDNIGIVGRMFYTAAPFICRPHARSEQGPHEVDNQVPDSRWCELLAEAGFSRFRRATETPFDRVFEVRP
jgi:hypothetical protein